MAPSGDLPHPGIELGSPVLQADSLPAELPGKPQLDPRQWLVILYSLDANDVSKWRRWEVTY